MAKTQAAASKKTKKGAEKQAVGNSTKALKKENVEDVKKSMNSKVAKVVNNDNNELSKNQNKQPEKNEEKDKTKPKTKLDKLLKVSKSKIKKIQQVKARKTEKKLKCQQNNLIKESNKKPILKHAWTNRLCHQMVKQQDMKKRVSKKFLRLFHAVCERNLATVVSRSVVVASKCGKTTLRPSHIHTQQVLGSDPSLQY